MKIVITLDFCGKFGPFIESIKKIPKLDGLVSNKIATKFSKINYEKSGQAGGQVFRRFLRENIGLNY